MKSLYTTEIIQDDTHPAIGDIEAGLEAYNQQFTQAFRFDPVNLVIRGESGETTAGLLGETYWDWLHIGSLLVHQDYRARGLGKTLLCRAEEEAVKRGAHQVHLDTHDFQAPGFY